MSVFDYKDIVNNFTQDQIDSGVYMMPPTPAPEPVEYSLDTDPADELRYFVGCYADRIGDESETGLAAQKMYCLSIEKCIRELSPTMIGAEIVSILVDEGMPETTALSLIRKLPKCYSKADHPVHSIKTIGDLVNHKGINPRTLLGNNYLIRGNGMLFVAPTGVGKSSAMTQCALLWAVGEPAFGICPTKKIKSIIIQAENDDQDIAEMRDGVIDGMVRNGYISSQQAQEAVSRVFMVHDTISTGDELGDAIGAYVKATGADMVILDPLFSYIGGDVNSAKDVSHFLRNVLNPVIMKHDVGLIVVHHTNKPPSGEQKQEFRAGDQAYLGSGSAEFANWARAVLAISNCGNHEVYKLCAGKRGARIGWRDEENDKETERYIKHDPEGICWLDATIDDLKEVNEREKDKREASNTHSMDLIDDATELVLSRVWVVGDFKQALADELGLKARGVIKMMKSIGENPVVGRASWSEGIHKVYIIGPKMKVIKAEETHTI